MIRNRPRKPVTERLSSKLWEQVWHPILVKIGYYRVYGPVRRRFTDKPPF